MVKTEFTPQIGKCETLTGIRTDFSTAESQTYTLQCGQKRGQYIKWESTQKVLIVETWSHTKLLNQGKILVKMVLVLLVQQSHSMKSFGYSQC